MTIEDDACNYRYSAGTVRSQSAFSEHLGRPPGESALEASARVIDAAERFAPSRPVAATKKLLLVALWLAEASAHLDRAAHRFEETFDWIAADAGSMA
jgi:hypothetical protein